MKMNTFLKHILATTLLLVLAYWGGAGVGWLTGGHVPASTTANADENSPLTSDTEEDFLIVSDGDVFLPVSSSASANWGLSFQEEGKPPVANASAAYLKDFNAYYIEETEEKKIYLTFDCGFENGNTPAILDALKKHNAPATFFIVGNYLETSPDLVKRMVEEGHIVANHTYHHPDMSQLGTQEAFAKELSALETAYEEVIGEPMKKYYRPPQGIYSESNLKMAKDLGYQTFFWSLAYVDWYENQQPSHQEAFDKLLPRIHSGAIVLLHNTSKTNAEILDELLTKWEELGYTFHSLEELCR